MNIYLHIYVEAYVYKVKMQKEKFWFFSACFWCNNICKYISIIKISVILNISWFGQWEIKFSIETMSFSPIKVFIEYGMLLNEHIVLSSFFNHVYRYFSEYEYGLLRTYTFHDETEQKYCRYMKEFYLRKYNLKKNVYYRFCKKKTPNTEIVYILPERGKL